jgi:hypothetical protein
LIESHFPPFSIELGLSLGDLLLRKNGLRLDFLKELENVSKV